MIACVTNTVYTLRRRKKYTLLGRALDKPPDTPSAHKIRYSGAQPEEEDDDETPPGSPVAKMIAFAHKMRAQARRDASANTEEVWELNMWDPPLFCLWLTTTFSPVHLLYIWYGSLNPAFIVMLAAISLYLHTMVRLFLTQLKDRSVLHSEVLGEYGKKLVRPIIAVPRRDVAVGTDDDAVEVYSPAQNTNFGPQEVRESRQRYSLGPTDLKPWRSPAARTSTPSLRQRASMNFARRSDAAESPLLRRSRNSNII